MFSLFSYKICFHTDFSLTSTDFYSFSKGKRLEKRKILRGWGGGGEQIYKPIPEILIITVKDFLEGPGKETFNPN